MNHYEEKINSKFPLLIASAIKKIIVRLAIREIISPKLAHSLINQWGLRHA